MAESKGSAYVDAGVDIDAQDEALALKREILSVADLLQPGTDIESLFAERVETRILDLASGEFEKITDWTGSDQFPMWGADGMIYFNSDREDGTLNIYGYDTGGMPSSHTSLVTTLTLAVGATEGVSSVLFSVVLIFSLYFVFEATGLRQEVGQQAKLLNEMVDELFQTHHLDQKRLRELVGHTWTEVLGGVVVGVVTFLVLRGWIIAD